jgi:hypothetical protein
VPVIKKKYRAETLLTTSASGLAPPIGSVTGPRLDACALGRALDHVTGK